MSALAGGVPQLGAQRTVVIYKRRILSPASCELRANGLTIPGCNMHIELLDVVTGTMYLVPVNGGQLSALVADARHALKSDIGNDYETGH